MKRTLPVLTWLTWLTWLIGTETSCAPQVVGPASSPDPAAQSSAELDASHAVGNTKASANAVAPAASSAGPTATPSSVPCPAGTTWDGSDCAIASASGGGGDPATATEPAARFALTTGTIIDTATALMWQRNHPFTKVKWADALRYCSSLPLAGGGWRLPTAKELASIAGEPSFAKDDRSAGVPLLFWSATRSDVDDSRAATVQTADGASRLYFKDLEASVRCVRGSN